MRPDVSHLQAGAARAACALIVLLAITGCHTSAKPVMHWSWPQLTATATTEPWQMMADLSPAGDAITIRLRAFLIHLGQTEPLFATRVLGLRIPVHVVQNAAVTTLEHRVVGIVENGNNAKTWMIAVVGGRVFWKACPPCPVGGSNASLLWEFKANLERPLHDDDQYTLQFFLVTQRASNQSPVTVAIDSISVRPVGSAYREARPKDHFTDPQIIGGFGVAPQPHDTPPIHERPRQEPSLVKGNVCEANLLNLISWD